DWIGHTEYSETRIEQLDHIFNLIGINMPAKPFQQECERDNICTGGIGGSCEEDPSSGSTQ
ncbi:hypothetical protein, partial [Aeromonas sp. QDB12]|uniref:hypothetical protein n=1 Tax=Aeromonas sp. QDB12 TaxID=2990483 RepID=UPI0022DF0B34